jgi:hypothetical protein
MAYLVPNPAPLLYPWVFHRHLGIDGKATAIPAPKSCSFVLNHFIVNIKAIASGAKEGTDTTTYALGGYFLPEVLVFKR